MAPHCMQFHHVWISIGDFSASIINIQLVLRRGDNRARQNVMIQAPRAHAGPIHQHGLCIQIRHSIQINFSILGAHEPKGEKVIIIQEQSV